MLKHKDLIDFTLNPFELFANWYDLAIETEINDPNARKKRPYNGRSK